MTILKKKRITQYFIIILLFSLHFSCQKDEISVSDAEENTETSDETTANSLNGTVRIKLTEDAVEQLSISLKSGSLKTSVTNIDSIISVIGATSFTRTFPYSGKFEARTKAAGLDRWYDVKYDTTQMELASVLSKFKALGEVNKTEAIRKIKNEAILQKKFDALAFSATLKSSSSSDLPFDDTYLSYQWNFKNDGDLVSNSKEGCDINVYNAWNVQTGSEDVIVAVVDGGIDYDHGDLEDNMWINDTENSGSSSSDDDNNGYTDDIYGYNFVDGNGTIVAHDHGTHVAGTIAARSGNGAGVCGIAGGNSTSGGVKLMSCQVFEEDEMGNEQSAEDFEAAIKYGADNGAVICQCSWGYDGATSLPESMKEAIDYFITYAGLDENNNQTGPMAGGIVFFAAGNDEMTTNAYPAMYDQVVAVGACGADYTIASYSNYGDWIDIMAPGGEGNYVSESDNDYILSTLPDDYLGWMAGTSQACPHVSGVAALIVSEYGGTGFTPSDLKEKLYQGAVDLDQYNNDYEGMMGVGLVNALYALKDVDTNVAPDAVTDLAAEASGGNVTLSWTVPADEDDEKPSGYTLYYSTSEFTTDNIEAGSSSLTSVDISSGTEDAGEQMSYTLKLDFTTTYYFRIAAYDVIDTYSDYSAEVSATTGVNNAPVITSNEGISFELKSSESTSFDITISDPDGDSYTYSYTDAAGGSSATESDNGVTVTINALSVDDNNTYTATLTATDEYDLSTSYTITYTVDENNIPTASTIDDIYIGDLSSSYSLDLSEYFTDADGEELNYNIDYTSSQVTASLSDQTLTLTPKTKGLSTITITAYDARDAEVSTSFQLMLRDDSEEIDVYPNPVTDYVYFRMGEDVSGTLNVKIYNDNGVLKDTRNLSISTFSPASTDLSDLSSGQYSLKITYNNEEIERNIIKL